MVTKAIKSIVVEKFFKTACFSVFKTSRNEYDTLKYSTLPIYVHATRIGISFKYTLYRTTFSLA